MIMKLEKDRGRTPYQALLDRNRALETEVQDLKIRLEEAEELRRAISEGDLDALIIRGPEEELVFTLDSADRAYRVLVETMNEGTVTFAGDGTILYCNRRFAELVRMRPQAIVGTSIYRFIESENEHIFKALLNQRTGAGEINLRAVGGISLPVYLSISSLQSEESQNTWCLVATDLTEKKNEEIVSAGRLAQSIIEQAAEAIIVCDTEGKITHFSNAVPRICECDPAFQKLEDIMDLRFSKGENADKSVRPVSSALKGETILGIEATLENKDCQDFHQHLNLLLNSGPLKNSNGGIIGCVVTLTDITELKQLEEKTRRRAEEIETIMETAPVAIWIGHDPKCHNITGNRTANEFYKAEAGENVSANTTFARRFFCKGCELTADELPMQQVSLKDIDMRDVEFDVLLPKGEWRTLLGSASPLHDAKGNVRGSIGTFIDITERKQAEKELLESEKRFKLLSEANSTLLLSKEPENMIRAIAEKVMHHLNCDVFFNYVFDETRGKLHLNACGGISAELAKEIEWLDKGSAICDCVARDGCRIVSEDIQHNEDKRANLVRLMGIQAYSCQPLRIGEKTIGTLSFGTKSRKGFKEDELTLMSTIADQVSVAIERKRAEEALRESEEKYRNIIETANEGIWILDPEARITYANQKIAEMLGYGHEEIIGRSAWDFTDYKGKEVARQNMEKIKQGIDGDHELKLIRKNGSPLWTIVSAKALFDKNGNFAGSMKMLTDITERKEAEVKLKQTLDNLEKLIQERTAELEKAYNSLKESERGLSEAQKMAHLGNWYRDLTTNEIHWSDEVYRIFGFKPQEFKVTSDMLLSYIHPEDRSCVKNNFKKALSGEPYSINYRIISANGTERIVHSQGEVVFNEKKIPVGIKGTIQDITEQKLAMEKIKKSEERIQLYLQNFRGIGTQLGKNFIPVFLHGAVEELTGYTKEDFLSEKVRWNEIVVPEDRPGLQEKAQKMKSTLGMTVRHEYRIMKKNGEIRWIHGIAQNISKPGNEELYQGMMYDITDRKKAEEALEKTDKIRIKEIHHRIKNNLQVICSILSLEAERFSDKKMLEAFKESQNRVVSMALIHEELYKGDRNDTLDFAAYLYKLTADLFSSYNLGNDNIILKMDLKEAYLDMDTAVPLGIIVNELVSNSLKHAFPAGSEGEIRISLRRDETFDLGNDISCPDQDCGEKGNFQYILEVTDNGKGIPEEIEFQSAESLGLQLVNILVDQIDGHIELCKEEGTEFTIWFENKGL